MFTGMVSLSVIPGSGRSLLMAANDTSAILPAVHDGTPGQWKSNTSIVTAVVDSDTIAKDAFNGCSALTSIFFPHDAAVTLVLCMRDKLIGHTPGLLRHVCSFAPRLEKIEVGAFWGCFSLTAVNIPNSVTSIEKSAFSSCSSLTSVDIPNSVTSIEYRAFYNCSS